MNKFYGTAAVMAACLLASAHAAEEQSQLLKTAYEFMARASSTSEVLTLNLTNLAILIGLKIIFFGFGIFGFANGGFLGGGNNSGKRRSNEDTATSLKQSELTGGMCFIMYTSGEIDKLSCVQRTACEDPDTATNYLTAAKMWHKMHKLMKVVPFNQGYVSVMNAIEDATEHSLNGGDCSIYKW